MKQKAIFVAYNQAFHGILVRLLEKKHQRGYTQWNEVMGKGSYDGNPHLGTHAWPTLNGAMMIITTEDEVEGLMEALRELDNSTPLQGLRAWSWNIESTI